ncbi:hypothetical protein, conserved [Eimeria necatrix]|uniref:ABC1 atypical kinase-like domain-containing protein n=1 Tax=Eimeria necatrix TaxID=51315 RepID=U6MPN3_9EIME|nr:hypothetical protein, conserved [Eimeria necatrix]CDJ64454.1 hypothetical protein, conserved [Eimeria necatrix]
MNTLRRAAARSAKLESFVDCSRYTSIVGRTPAIRKTRENVREETPAQAYPDRLRGLHTGISRVHASSRSSSRGFDAQCAGRLLPCPEKYTHPVKHGRCARSGGGCWHSPCDAFAECNFVGQALCGVWLKRIPAVAGSLAPCSRTNSVSNKYHERSCWQIGWKAHCLSGVDDLSVKCLKRHISSQHFAPRSHERASAIPAEVACGTWQLPVRRFSPRDNSEKECRCGSNSSAALALAAAATLALPLHWIGQEDAPPKNKSDASPAETKTLTCSPDECSPSRPLSGHVERLEQIIWQSQPAFKAVTLVAGAFESMQHCFSNIKECIAGEENSIYPGDSLRAQSILQSLRRSADCCFIALGFATRQALELVTQRGRKVCVVCSDGDYAINSKTARNESSQKQSISGIHELEQTSGCAHAQTSQGNGKEPSAAAAAESASSVQFQLGQPQLFCADAAVGPVAGAECSRGWLAELGETVGFFFRMVASVLQRLLYVLPLALIVGAAGFWLLTLPFVSGCLQMLGLRGQRVAHWESVLQRELEEVIFTAVTAAASAAGPTYVKLLQWIATRPDLFNESLCARCARLQTSARPFSYPRAALLLREQFGDDVMRHLLLDPKPIGCGCIAQVYRAYLLLSDEADEKSKRTFLDHAFVLGGSMSKPVSAEIGSTDKIPPVAVAVKVMRPGVREAMEFDLRVMLLIASVLQYLPAFGFVALKNSVEEFAVTMRRQLDFGLEEKHLKLFRSNFGLSSTPVPDDLLPLHNKCRRKKHCDPLPVDSKAEQHHTNILGSLSRKILGMRRQVTFPYPFEALSSSEVLVMTLESGFTLNQLLKARAKQQEAPSGTRKPQGESASDTAGRSQQDDSAALSNPVARSIIERFNSVGMICLHSFLQMVFLDNFFHGDMHSGNLLCRFSHNNKELIFPVLSTTLPNLQLKYAPRLDGPLELVVLDCGLAGSLEQADRVNFVTLLEAVGKKRGRDAALAMLQRARRSACKDEDGFCSEVEKLIDEYHFEEGNSLQMSRVRFTSLMGKMLSLSKKYCVELDPSFVSIVVAMSVLEGVGAQLCPDADVLRTALPYTLMAAKLLGCDSG